MTYKLYRLKATIPNAQHDRRHKRDLYAIPEFKAGVKFALQASMPEPKERFRHPAHLYYDGIATMINQDLEQLLVAASEEVQPETWTDIVWIIDYGVGHWLAKDVINHIIDRGILSADQVMTIATNCYNAES